MLYRTSPGPFGATLPKGEGMIERNQLWHEKKNPKRRKK